MTRSTPTASKRRATSAAEIGTRAVIYRIKEKRGTRREKREENLFAIKHKQEIKICSLPKH